MGKRLCTRLLAVCAIAVLSIPAQATGLMGTDLSWQYYAFGGPFTSGSSSGTFTVTGGVGGTFSDGFATYFNIVADDTSITFDYSVASIINAWASSSLSLAPTIYNGIAIDLVSGSPFLSVTIDPLTNMTGFDSTRFSFTGSQIQVDWADLSWNTSTRVKLDVNTVPEPSTVTLCLIGLLGIGISRRLRSRPRS